MEDQKVRILVVDDEFGMREGCPQGSYIRGI